MENATDAATFCDRVGGSLCQDAPGGAGSMLIISTLLAWVGDVYSERTTCSAVWHFLAMGCAIVSMGVWTAFQSDVGGTIGDG